MLNEARDTVEIYLWSDSDGEFVHQSSLDLKTSGYIENVIPGDFDMDGQLDLLVTRNTSTVQVVEIYIRQKLYSFQNPQYSFNVSGQPSALDVSGDMAMDLVLNLIDSDGTIQTFVEDRNTADHTYKPNPLEQYAFQSSAHCLESSNRTLSIPNSVAFVDLNKDCLADLFLTTYDNVTGLTYFEVWLNMKNGMYCIVYVSPAPVGAGHVSFADVDRNGAEDLIFPVCRDVNCTEQEIRVVYNDNAESTTCDYDTSVVSFKKFALPTMSNVTTQSTLVQPMSKPYSFVQTDPDIPVTLRTGDFDLDGYPDFLAVVDDGSGLGPFCALFLNKKAESGRRTFVMQTGGEFEKLKAKRGAYLCTFFDLDENGVFDILITLKNETGVSTIYSFYNNFLEDAFHLKALTLSGAGKQQYSSSSYSGPVFMFTITELDMTPVQMHSTQLTQSSYFALQTPYNIYGIGRTNSYIEEFSAAIPTIAHSTRMWTPIIPNSYLIVSPTKTNVDSWFLELFASPTDKIGVIIIGAAFFLLFIGGIVVYRYRKEKDEDRQLAVGFL